MKSATVRYASVNGESGFRIDPGYYVNEAVRYYASLGNCPYPLTTIGDESSRIFFGNIFVRRFVNNPDHGTPYLTPTDMLKTDMAATKLLSKQQALRLSHLKIESGWILISCSGSAALGSVALSDRRHEGMIGTHDLIRLIPNDRVLRKGFLYAFLKSRFGRITLTHSKYGSCILHINPDYVATIRIPVFPVTFQRKIHGLIMESVHLREEADAEEKIAVQNLLSYSKLRKLTSEDYNYFGPRSSRRNISTFSIKFGSMTELSINAFNYSDRMRKTIDYVRSTCETIPLSETLSGGGFFSTGSFPRLELDSPKSLLLINQSDIFNARLTGKKIARRGVKAKSLVEYGEVIIAGVGTLGESETFCRVVFANESLVGQLISGEFIRMKTTDKIPPGYLYAWLHSDYGFRMIRSTQAGTKLCRPIQKLLLQMPVPVLRRSQMDEINQVILTSQTKRARAAQLENEAIGMVEREIESWQEGGV